MAQYFRQEAERRILLNLIESDEASVADNGVVYKGRRDWPPTALQRENENPVFLRSAINRGVPKIESTDPDIEALSVLCARAGRPLNFEMALTQEMLDIALRHRPHAVCIVPERREEVTTEGGLNVQAHIGPLFFAVQQLKEVGIRVSLFIDPSKQQVMAATGVGAQVVEFHTGRYCHVEGEARRAAFQELTEAVAMAHSVGLEVHAGHGLDYETAAEIATLPQIRELNIGHFLIGEAIFIGLDEAIARMRSAIDGAAF